MLDITDGLYNKIFQNDGYDHLQIELDIKSQKVDDKGETKKSIFHVQTKKLKINSDDLSSEIARQLHKNTLNHYQEGSGWVVSGIGNLRVDYYKTTRNMKSYGSYVEWPKGVPGSKHVVNIRTTNDCVKLSMVAHFCHQEVQKLKNCQREAVVYKKKVGDYFNFPTDIPTPISIENFDKIEKQTLTDIWLYQVSKNDKTHSIRLLRKGKNSSAPPNRVIHLCQIDDSDHLVLIKNIEPFIRCIRPSNYSKKEIESGRFCKICFSYMKTNRYSRHYNQCLQFKGYQT